MSFSPTLAIFCLLALLSFPLEASQELDFGLGGITSGRASNVTAEVNNPFAARYNPALIAAEPTPLFGFSVASAGAHYSPLRSVLVDSPRFRTQDAVARTQDFQLPDTTMTVWAVGGTYPFYLPFLGDRSGGLGFTLSGPMGQQHQISATTPYDFGSLHYGATDSQLKATVSGSLELWPKHLFLGGGLTFYLTSTGMADAHVATDNPTGRAQVDLGLNSAAVAGLLAQADNTALSFVYHQEIGPSFEQQMNPKVQFGGRDAFQLPFTARTVFYYEPHLFESDLQHDFGFFTGAIGASYQLWSRYQPSFLTLQTQDAAGNPVATSVPALNLKNTWNPRASVQVPFLQKHLILGAGYEYRPSPITELSGATNVLDTNTHVAGMSLQYQFHAGELFASGLRLGIFGQYHWLASRAVTKSSAEFIGAPSYTVSGRAYTYGASVEAEL